jgi:hypothetical protein
MCCGRFVNVHNFGPVRNPIGDGTSAVPCETYDFPSVSNGWDDVAQVRRSACEIGPFAGQDILSFFVFVHKSRQTRREENLVFRDDLKFDGSYGLPPAVTWLGRSSLKVAVVNTGEVTRELTSMNGVSIYYAWTRRRLLKSTGRER